MKLKCTKCKKLLLTKFFSKKNKGLRKFQHYCKNCQKFSLKQFYKRRLGYKICNICLKRKLKSSFWKDNHLKDGYHSTCKFCLKVKIKKYRNSLPKTILSSWYRNGKLGEYGLTLEDYVLMFNQQKGLCKICGKKEIQIYKNKPKRLAIDHDHKTGKIRGLLCSNCNRGIGFLQHNIKILKSSISYLKGK